MYASADAWGGAELWLSVGWAVGGRRYSLGKPIHWSTHRSYSPEQLRRDYVRGQTVGCRYLASEPGTIYPDRTAVHAERMEFIPISYFGAAVMALLSICGMVVSRRRAERRASVAVIVQRVLVPTCAFVLVVLLQWRPVSPWIWGPIALAVSVPLGRWAYIFNTWSQPMKPRLPYFSLTNAEYWPESSSDRSRPSLFEADRICGLRNGVRVRLARSRSDVLIEADVVQRHSRLRLRPRGRTKIGEMSIGHEAFDRVVATETGIDDAIRVLTPKVRGTVLAAVGQLGAGLANSVLSVRVPLSDEETLKTQMQLLVDAARELNRRTPRFALRYEMETAPEIKLALCRAKTPMPRGALEALSQDESVPSSIRRAAYELLHPHRSIDGAVTLAGNTGHVSVTDQ